jgi:predicted metal-dependent hydrolase
MLGNELSDTYCQIVVDDLSVDVVRKVIKNLHLAVYHPDGRVRVAAPLRLDDEVVRMAMVFRLAWIRKQQAQFAAQPQQSPRQFVAGETHYYLGGRYRLRVEASDGTPGVRVCVKRTIELRVRPGSTQPQRRRSLHALAAQYIADWEPRLGVALQRWAIKRMKTCWGTCTPAAGRITLNLALIHHPRRASSISSYTSLTTCWNPRTHRAFGRC